MLLPSNSRRMDNHRLDQYPGACHQVTRSIARNGTHYLGRGVGVHLLSQLLRPGRLQAVSFNGSRPTQLYSGDKSEHSKLVLTLTASPNQE